jgi:hypothetical protein
VSLDATTIIVFSDANFISHVVSCAHKHRAREKISQTFRDAMGEAYSSSNPYKRKRRSFEKKHNAIVDIITHRRGSSPTSVLQSGSSGPPTPEPVSANDTTTAAIRSSVVSSTLATCPPISLPQPAPSTIMLDDLAMFNKRPGQIGFARRSMFHFGLPGVGNLPPLVGRSTSMPMSPMSLATASALGMFRRPIPMFAGAGSTVSMPPLAPLSRRVSLPFNSALLSAEMIHRQRMAMRHAAMIRRPSLGA